MKNNTAYFFVFMFWVFSVNAQSKKEQIENLNYQIDSLNQVLLKEKKLNTNSTNQISQLNAELTRLNASISSLNAEVSKLTSSLKSNQEELSKLQAQLKVKSDSLLLVQKELNALKPPSIQINNTPAVVSLQKGPYKTVQIGTQVWMTKNLDVSTFRNGDPIPEAKTDEEWEKAGENKQPAWCYYNNDPGNGEKYGKLYNWYAVNDSRGLAPVGYHIPSDAEWTILTDFLGGEDAAGNKMKSMPIYETKIRYVEEGGYDETKWVACTNCKVASPEYKKICPSCKGNGGKIIKTGKYIPKTKRKVEDKINIGWDGTNESGFSGLPSGYRSNFGFSMVGEFSSWWSSTELKTLNAFYLCIDHRLSSSREAVVSSSFSYKTYGYTVRCIKD